MKILIAVDGSEFSQEAVREVARRQWPVGSEVRVSAVIKLPFVPTAETRSLPESDYSRLESELTAQAQQAVDAARAALAAARTVAGEPLTFSASIIAGNPNEMLLTEARDWQADLLVVGARGLGGFKRLMLGSVSQTLAQQAPCSVLIVRGSGAA